MQYKAGWLIGCWMQNAFELSLALAKDRFNRIRLLCPVADKNNDKDTVYFLQRIMEEEVCPFAYICPLSWPANVTVFIQLVHFMSSCLHRAWVHDVYNRTLRAIRCDLARLNRQMCFTWISNCVPTDSPFSRLYLHSMVFKDIYEGHIPDGFVQSWWYISVAVIAELSWISPTWHVHMYRSWRLWIMLLVKLELVGACWQTSSQNELWWLYHVYMVVICTSDVSLPYCIWVGMLVKMGCASVFNHAGQVLYVCVYRSTSFFWICVLSQYNRNFYTLLRHWIHVCMGARPPMLHWNTIRCYRFLRYTMQVSDSPLVTGNEVQMHPRESISPESQFPRLGHQVFVERVPCLSRDKKT